MLVNDIEEITEDKTTLYSEPADVRFICYDRYDKYCNLCSGVLELQINGKKWLFSNASKEEDICPAFFAPTVCFSNGYVAEKHTTWETDISVLPEELRCFGKVIDEVINANMPTNICLGCQ